MTKKMSFDSRIIEHLGKDLITAPEVALIELIKNSIDAKSQIINLNLYSSFSDKILQNHNAFFDINIVESDLLNKPCILVEDFGVGMNESLMEEGFLKVGTQIKLQESDVLFGQKGIGRLAAQRLGKVLILETTQKNDMSVNIAIIDWSQIVNLKINDIEVPCYLINKKDASLSFTRLWILDATIDDIITRPQQESFFEDEFVELKTDVASALAFLVSPYDDSNSVSIKVSYNSFEIPIAFNKDFLAVAESVHSFRLYMNNESKLNLEMRMGIKPFFIEKIHKTRLGSEVDFTRYKLTPQGYVELYKRYEDRFENTLYKNMQEEELIAYFQERFKNIYRKKLSAGKKEKYLKYINDLAVEQIKNLAKISEISGKIFSFKRDNIVGSIYVDFVQQQEKKLLDATVRDVQKFLRDFNGVKLYRNKYRIGFLGNRDNDWIEMQQYRTMGQQFYRFNLGDSLGYVKINDSKQKYIKEISSRLDIYADEVAKSFKDFINYVFNDFFYKFNKSADDITRDILLEEGLIDKKLPEKVAKASADTEELLKQNKELITKIINTKQLLNRNTIIDKENAVIPTKIYKTTIDTLENIESNANKTQNVIAKSQKLLSEATTSLNKIEIEAFNNYKLMANGLITETITHELHSLVKDKKYEEPNVYWSNIGNYLIDNNVQLYNQDFKILQNVYDTVISKISDISDLYNLLEGTFVKGDSKSDFASENIGETLKKIELNLNKELKKQRICLLQVNLDFTMLLPKGVMLHVLYNLITNAEYWIDYRRKKAKYDVKYKNENGDKDFIKVERVNNGSIEVTDSGCGVLKNMEHVLFEALQSGKEANQGRGMGLYIVKRLLNSFDADIYLSEERNSYGNRYKFIITLPAEI